MRKPLFSGIAGICLLISALLLRNAMSAFEQGATIGGYNSLSISFSLMVALVLTGLVTGQIGLIRGEKPVALPILALLLNGVIFMTAIVIFPR